MLISNAEKTPFLGNAPRDTLNAQASPRTNFSDQTLGVSYRLLQSDVNETWKFTPNVHTIPRFTGTSVFRETGDGTSSTITFPNGKMIPSGPQEVFDAAYNVTGYNAASKTFRSRLFPLPDTSSVWLVRVSLCFEVVDTLERAVQELNVIVLQAASALTQVSGDVELTFPAGVRSIFNSLGGVEEYYPPNSNRKRNSLAVLSIFSADITPINYYMHASFLRVT